MDSPVIKTKDVEGRKSTTLRLREKIKQLEASKKMVDEEVEELKMKLLNVVDSFTGRKANQRKIKKMLAVSLVASLSSLTLGIRSCFGSTSRDVSWPLLVGVGSLVFSFCCFKDLLSSDRRQAEDRFVQELYLSLLVPPVNSSEPERSPMMYKMKRFPSISLPEEIFTLLLHED